MKCCWILLVVLMVTLVGCNDFNSMGTDNSPKPAALVKLQPSVSVTPSWSARTGKGVDDIGTRLLTAIADGKVITADSRGKVSANSASTGRLVWQSDAKTSISSGPVVGNGLVVVGTNDGHVIAFRINDGSSAWQATVSNQVLAPPKITSNHVIVKTIDGKLSALDIRNGSLLWIYDHGAPLLVLRKSSAPQMVDNIVVSGFPDGKLAGFNAKSGKLLWEQAIAYPTGASDVERIVDIGADPVVIGHLLYATSYQGSLACLNPQAGSVRWQHDIAPSKDLVADGELLLLTDTASHIWVFNRDTGRVAWMQSQLAARNITAPVVMGNMIVVGDAEGYLHWLSRRDGHLLAQTLVDKAGIVSPPVVYGDTLFVSTQNGRLLAFNVKNA